jgi:hypothetical protein
MNRRMEGNISRGDKVKKTLFKYYGSKQFNKEGYIKPNIVSEKTAKGFEKEAALRVKRAERRAAKV